MRFPSNVAIQLSAAGTLAPSTPKVARVSTMVGALPRLPAMEMTPTSRNDTTTPMVVMMVACQKEMPNPNAHAPYDMANTETSRRTKPEQAGRRAFAFLFGNGVYALFLDGEGTFILAHFRLCLLRFLALPRKCPCRRKAFLVRFANRSDTS